jgi:hypothetical protein
MGQNILLGPLVIPANLLSIGLAALIVYLYFRLLRTEKQDVVHPVFDCLMNGFLYALLAWKLSPLLYKPAFFFQDPILILYYRGGRTELLIGLLVFLLYMTYRWLKQTVSLTALANVILLIAISAGFIEALLVPDLGRTAAETTWLHTIFPFENHPVHLYQMFLHLLLLIWVVWKGVDLRSRRWLGGTLLVYALISLLLTGLKAYPFPLLGLIPPLYFYLALLVLAIIILILEWKRRIATLDNRQSDSIS